METTGHLLLVDEGETATETRYSASSDMQLADIDLDGKHLSPWWALSIIRPLAQEGERDTETEAANAAPVPSTPVPWTPGCLDACMPDQFQQVMQALHDAVYIVNREGYITYANAAFARLTRYTVEEVLGSLSTQFYVSEDTTLFLERRQLALQGEPVSPRLETEIRCKDGTRVPVELSVTNLVQEGQIIGRVAVARDISERKRLEERLRQAQKMEALGTLAGGIAHHFNNIFAIIMGYAEMALDEVPQDSQLWSNLQEVRTAGYRAADLVRQTLTLSRQRIWERQPIPLHPAVQEALTMLQVSLPATIETRQQLRKDAGSVLADPVAIRQILLHLGTNAVHAMRDTGGVLEIRLDAVHIDAAFAADHPELRPGPHVRLTVGDTGHGMPPEVMTRIFEPFYTTKGVGEGTGIGLAVVHGIVASHDGAITVQSVPGQGTDFAIYVPCTQETAAVSETPEASGQRGLGCILFVDDEATLTYLGQEVLAFLGYDVVASTSSREALDLFRAMPQRFDLVITDNLMPHMTGEVLAQELRRIRSDIPIILCTGSGLNHNAKTAQALGMDALVMKPWDIADFARTVKQVLEQ